MSFALPCAAMPARFAPLMGWDEAVPARTGAAGGDVLSFDCFASNRHKASLDPTLISSESAPVAADVSAAAHAERAERDTLLARLLAEAAAGQTTSFERFYDATIGYARALARRMVKGADLEDLLADVFFQAWREAARFDAERGSAVTWLLTLVRSRALDMLRKQRKAHEVEVESDVLPDAASDLPGPDDLLSGTQAGTRLHAALAQLSSNERWMVGLAYYSDLSHREIAEQTGLPLGTVKSLILRAQGKLREQLTTL